MLTLLREWGLACPSGRCRSTRWWRRAGDGKLEEVWGTGTAAVISPVGELAYKGERIVINGGHIGPLTQKLYDAIVGIQYGKAPDPHGWTVRGLGDRDETTASSARSATARFPSMKIYEDERTLAFMDINPLNAGHCLVITKRTPPRIFEAEPADLQAAIATAKRVALAMREALKPDGLNVLQANGAGRLPVGAALPSAPDPALDQRRQGLRLEAGAGRPRPDHEAMGERIRARARRAADDGRAHGPRRRRQAGARRPRSRRQDRRAGAAGRGLRGDLHRACTRRPSRSSPPRCRRTPTPSGSACSPAPTTISSSACSSCCTSKGADDIAVFGGGIIPPEDIAALKALGVKELFTPGTSTQDIIRFVRENIRAAV